MSRVEVIIDPILLCACVAHTTVFLYKTGPPLHAHRRMALIGKMACSTAPATQIKLFAHLSKGSFCVVVREMRVGKHPPTHLLNAVFVHAGEGFVPFPGFPIMVSTRGDGGSEGRNALSLGKLASGGAEAGLVLANALWNIIGLAHVKRVAILQNIDPTLREPRHDHI